MNGSGARVKKYNNARNSLALFEPVAALCVLAIIQISGISSHFANISSGLSGSWYAAVAVYAVLFGASYYLATLYLSFYSGYVIEHRFGLSNQTLIGWVSDEIKRAAISFILFLIFIESLYFLLRNAPRLWWLFMSLAWISITVLLVKMVPVLIIPLFYKFEPMNDQDLRDRLVRLAERCGIRILDVFKISLSAKTKKANAALVGLGNTRRILLGDTLIENYTKDEIEVVLAHELAHHKLLHMWKLILFGSLCTLGAFFIAERASPIMSGMHQSRRFDDIGAFPTLIFTISLASLLFSPLKNLFSRCLEEAADTFALKITGMPKAFISCMKKLADQNLSDTSPGRIVEILLYDHPPIMKRIKKAELIAQGGCL